MKQRLGIVLAFGVALTLALSGCDFGLGGETGTPGATGTPAASATTAGTRGPGVASADATLKHEPSGTVDLTWTRGDQSLKVEISLSGLAPSTSHPAHIHTGSCAQQGTTIHGLQDLAADATGKATLSQTIPNVEGGMPTSGWYINIHNAPGTDTYAKMDIACADITGINTSVPDKQTAHLTFTRGMAPSQNASGQARLRIENGNLVVTLRASGLEPGSTHPAHIHIGSCESQGAVVHPLQPLVADVSGNATSTSTISNVASIPSGGWYVNVHRGINLDGQIDFDPIICGNITAAG